MASNLRALCQTCTFRFFRALLSLSLNILLFNEYLPRFILKHAIFPGKKLYPEVQSNPTASSTKMSSMITQHSSIHLKAMDNHDTSVKYAQNKTSVNNANPTRVDLQALRRKIDWRIVPIMFLCYTVQFLDKVNINVCFSSPLPVLAIKDLTIIQYAAVMGLNADLNLTGNDFSNASTAFFIAYLIAEVPNSMCLVPL
jgi:hypothetical protein